MVPSPTQSQIMQALRSFLLGVLPTGVPVVLGQINRVAEPKGSDFVVMTPIRQVRLGIFPLIAASQLKKMWIR